MIIEKYSQWKLISSRVEADLRSKIKENGTVTSHDQYLSYVVDKDMRPKKEIIFAREVTSVCSLGEIAKKSFSIDLWDYLSKHIFVMITHRGSLDDLEIVPMMKFDDIGLVRVFKKGTNAFNMFVNKNDVIRKYSDKICFNEYIRRGENRYIRKEIMILDASIKDSQLYVIVAEELKTLKFGREEGIFTHTYTSDEYNPAIKVTKIFEVNLGGDIYGNMFNFDTDYYLLDIVPPRILFASCDFRTENDVYSINYAKTYPRYFEDDLKEIPDSDIWTIKSMGIDEDGFVVCHYICLTKEGAPKYLKIIRFFVPEIESKIKDSVESEQYMLSGKHSEVEYG